MLLFPNCSLLRAGRLELHGPFTGAPPSMCFCDGQSSVFVAGTSQWVGPAFSLQLDGRPCKLSLQGYPPPPGVLPAAPPRLYHTKSLLLRCCPSHMRLNAVAPWGTAMPSRSTWRLKSMDALWEGMTLSPKMDSSVILATNTKVAGGPHPRVSFTKAS
jgi:hypothetical protein